MNTIDAMGGEAISSVDVSAQPQVVTDPQSVQEQLIPYDRFSSVVAEKNQYKQELESYRQKYEQVLQDKAQNPQVVQNPQIPEFTTQAELINYINGNVQNLVKNSIQEAIQPIQRENIKANYQSGVSNFLAATPGAKELAPQMKAEIDRLPDSYK